MKKLFKFNLLLSAVVALVLLSSFVCDNQNCYCGNQNCLCLPPGPMPNDPPPLSETVFRRHETACNWFWYGINGVWYLYMCPEYLCWDSLWDTCNYPVISHSRDFPPTAHMPWLPCDTTKIHR